MNYNKEYPGLVDQVLATMRRNDINATDLAKIAGIGVSSVYKIVRLKSNYMRKDLYDKLRPYLLDKRPFSVWPKRKRTIIRRTIKGYYLP